MQKELKLICLSLVIAITFCGLMYILGKIYIKHERTNDLYIEMKEINDNQTLIGLSKKEVVELLGEPMERYSSKDNYWYNAGYIYEGLILGNYNILTESNWYVLEIIFDETDKVQTTSMKYVP